MPTPGYSGCVMWGTNVWPGPDGWTATYAGVEDASGQQTIAAHGRRLGANAGWVFYEVDTWSDESGSIDLQGPALPGGTAPSRAAAITSERVGGNGHVYAVGH